MMKLLPQHKCLLFIIFFFFLFGASGTACEGVITAWEEFVVKRELEPHSLLHTVGYRESAFLGQEESSAAGASYLLFDTHPERCEERAAQRVRTGRIQVSFSRIMRDGYRLDPADRSADSKSTLEEFKSMTNVLRSGTYRDTFEFFGNVFQPQINLSIEF